MEKIKLAIAAIAICFAFTITTPLIAGDHGGRSGGGGGHHVGGGGGGGGGHFNRPGGGGGHVQRPGGGGGHINRPNRPNWPSQHIEKRPGGGGGGFVKRPGGDGHVNRPDRDRHDGNRNWKRPGGDWRHWSGHGRHGHGWYHGRYIPWWPQVYWGTDPCTYAYNQWLVTQSPYWYQRWLECQGY